ncbi:hypothetical protein C2W64_01136 [Brevibacillus laterosporus]|nr:hypothetical protein C2W64_01136 [Brevibacillus laterosporus]
MVTKKLSVKEQKPVRLGENYFMQISSFFVKNQFVRYKNPLPVALDEL